MTVKFWGVRGSIPAPGPRTNRYGGNTPCVEVRCGEALFVLDAGSGIRELGNALMAAGKPVKLHLLISHTHWDHLQGFPFFTPLYVPGNVLHIYGPQGADGTLETVLAGQMTLPYFPVLLSEAQSEVHFHELDVGEHVIDGVKVTTIFANHLGIALAYRLEWGGKSLVYLCDNEPCGSLAGSVQEPPPIDPRLAEFARDADLLIADAPYDAEEYQQRRGWGHGSVDDVVRVALDAGAKRLALFHHDPAHDDDAIDRLVAQARDAIAASGAAMECFGAQEGQTVEL